MARVVDILSRQRLVTECLIEKGPCPTVTHRSLSSVYGDDVTDASWDKGSVALRPLKMTLLTKSTAADRPRQRRRRPKERLMCWFGMTAHQGTWTVCAVTAIGKPEAVATIRGTGCRKVNAMWVPRMYTVEHKTATINICAKLLQRSEKDGDDFLSKIIAGDKPELKWRGIVSRRRTRKKLEVQTSTDRIVASVFWDSQWILLVELLNTGATNSSQRHVQTLKKLKQRIRRARANRNMNRISSCMTTPYGTQVCAQLQQWGGLFHLIHPTVSI